MHRGLRDVQPLHLQDGIQAAPAGSHPILPHLPFPSLLLLPLPLLLLNPILLFVFLSLVSRVLSVDELDRDRLPAAVSRDDLCPSFLLLLLVKVGFLDVMVLALAADVPIVTFMDDLRGGTNRRKCKSSLGRQDLVTKFLVKITFLHKLIGKKLDFVLSKLQISF